MHVSTSFLVIALDSFSCCIIASAVECISSIQIEPLRSIWRFVLLYLPFEVVGGPKSTKTGLRRLGLRPALRSTNTYIVMSETDQTRQLFDMMGQARPMATVARNHHS